MKIVDINVLLYAVNRDSPHHDKCRIWLEKALAIERGARLYSTDNDFSRFPMLRWTNPAE